ncbi:hypothetical protein B1R94_22610 [Mycolicibacterium litorale]|nr:hypothetical protein B1R94_22610 [Mycolicibacterium litorale]
MGYRDSCAPAEVSFPASVLNETGVARWLRDHRFAVDVRVVPELHTAVSVGIHPALMTVHAEQLETGDIRRAALLGVGRVVLGCAEHIAWLGTGLGGGRQNVLLRMTDAPAAAPDRRPFVFESGDTDNAVEEMMANRSVTLIGLQCDVGSAVDDFVSYPAAIGNMIAQMDHIRRRHGVVLTRLVLGGGSVSATESSVVRRDLAEEIDESVDDACATLRFPRPAIVISAGGQVTGRHAA